MVMLKLQFIDPFRLAENEEALSGSVNLNAMQRLREVLCGDSGDAEYQLQFGIDDQGITCIQGEFSAILKIQCQRCMKPMSLSLSNRINVAVVLEQDEPDNIPQQYDVLLLNDTHLALETLIEDEILLALPISPLHDRDSCEAADLIKEHMPAKENPFAVLRDLKQRKL